MHRLLSAALSSSVTCIISASFSSDTHIIYSHLLILLNLCLLYGNPFDIFVPLSSWVLALISFKAELFACDERRERAQIKNLCWTSRCCKPKDKVIFVLELTDTNYFILSPWSNGLFNISFEPVDQYSYVKELLDGDGGKFPIQVRVLLRVDRSMSSSRCCTRWRRNG